MIRRGDILVNHTFYPFSGKMAHKIDAILKPLLGPGGKYEGKAKVIYRIQVQPWHATSTLTSEAGLAVLKASPEYFWPFSLEVIRSEYPVTTSNQRPHSSISIKKNTMTSPRRTSPLGK